MTQIIARCETTGRELTASELDQVQIDLNELSSRIITDPPIPPIGATAANALNKCFEQTANDVLRLAADHVARALRLQEDATRFATSIRDTGALFCQQIEEQATRGSQISNLMQEARDILARQ